MIRYLVLPILILTASTAFTQNISRSPLGIGYSYQPSTDINDGSEFSTQSCYVRAGLPLLREPVKFIAFTTRYEWTSYDFEGSRRGSFGALDPWDEVHALKFGLPVFWDLNDDWTFFALPSLGLNFEDGADVEDSVTGSLLAGATYQFSDSLSIGPGFGVRSQLEDSLSVFPIVLVDWQLSENLKITTRPSGAFISGPGVTVDRQLSNSWRAAFGATYENTRFRLSDPNRAASEGIGEYSSVPLYAALTFQPTANVHAGVFAGVRFANELQLENSRGHNIIREDADPAPFFGLNLSLHF